MSLHRPIGEMHAAATSAHLRRCRETVVLGWVRLGLVADNWDVRFRATKSGVGRDDRVGLVADFRKVRSTAYEHLTPVYATPYGARHLRLYDLRPIKPTFSVEWLLTLEMKAAEEFSQKPSPAIVPATIKQEVDLA